MKNTDLKNKTTEKLESELTAVKIISGALIVVLVPLFALTIYGMISNKNSSNLPLLVVAISCSAILPIQFSNMKKIKTELNRRRED